MANEPPLKQLDQVKIREGTSGDEQLLIDLERDAFGDAAWPDASIGNVFTQAFTYVLLGAADNLGQQEPLGFLVWRQIADEAEILSIGVVPKARGCHVARQIMTEFEQMAQLKGLVRAVLDVNINNAPALALYGACGYHQVGMRRKYYRNGADALVMEKSLV